MQTNKLKAKVVYFSNIDHLGVMGNIPIKISFIDECDECGKETNNLKETPQGDLCDDCIDYFDIEVWQE